MASYLIDKLEALKEDENKIKDEFYSLHKFYKKHKKFLF